MFRWRLTRYSPTSGSDTEPRSARRSEVGARMSEPDDQFADVTEMVLVLKSLDEGSRAHRRQYEAVIERTLPLAANIARRFGGRGEPAADL
jgi:hypothetical protein